MRKPHTSPTRPHDPGRKDFRQGSHPCFVSLYITLAAGRFLSGFIFSSFLCLYIWELSHDTEVMGTGRHWVDLHGVAFSQQNRNRDRTEPMPTS